MKRMLLLSLLLVFGFLGTTHASLLPSNAYVTWENLDWTWASPVASEIFPSSGNVLSAPDSINDGWRYASDDELALLKNLSSTDRLALFSDGLGGYIHSFDVWNSVYDQVTSTNDLAYGYIVSSLGNGAYEMIYVRDISSVPVPGTISLISLGLLSLAGLHRRKK